MSDKRRGGCMARFREGLYSVHIESCVITLTLVSVLAITGELLINLHIVQVPPDISNGGADGSGNNTPTDVQSTSNGSTGSPADPGGGNPYRPLDTAKQVFHYISLVIAAIFLIEIMLKILAKGKSYFLKIFQVADALIVLGAFALEVVFTAEPEELPLLEAATYVVILRLWRVPHVCNIRAAECRREMGRELEVWQNAKVKLEDRCRELQAKMDKTQDQVRDLEKQLEKQQTADRSLTSSQTDVSKVRVKQQSKGAVANGHIPKVTFSEVSEVKSDDDTSTTNQQSAADAETPDTVSDPLSDDAKMEASDHKQLNENDDVLVDSADGVDSVDGVDCAGHSQARGPISRTDSESSLSVDHVEQEVVVQIEGQPSPKRVSTTDETINLIQEEGKDGDFAYVNGMFEDEVVHRGLPILHEIDGVRTYRSADGIPMTSL